MYTDAIAVSNIITTTLDNNTCNYDPKEQEFLTIRSSIHVCVASVWGWHIIVQSRNFARDEIFANVVKVAIFCYAIFNTGENR